MGLPSDWVEVSGLTREMKLRALGNGVVPQQAAFAIRVLSSDLEQSADRHFGGVA
jgi:DNA (cytosine-5)-methyltransferase 1